MELHERIAELKRILLRRGFYQGELEGPKGEVCLRGAIGVMYDGSPVLWFKDEELDDFLNHLAMEKLEYVNEWDGTDFPDTIIELNDSSSFAEVMDFLDEAELIAKERAEQ